MNYAVRRFPGYGKLSGKSLDELHAGERVAVLEGKEDPLDFVLWKAAKPTEPADAQWDSAYGRGRPGLAHRVLGHGLRAAGRDLRHPRRRRRPAVPAPRERDRAERGRQSASRWRRYWMHNGFVNIDNEKMSKSLGNFFTIREVLKKFDAETLRFFIVRAHYRSPLNYSDVHLDDARGALKRLYTALDLVAPAQVAIDWTEPHAGALQGGDGQRLRHARGGGRAVRAGGRGQPRQVAAAGRPAQGAGRLPGHPAGRPASCSCGPAPRWTRPPSQQLIEQRAAAKKAKNFAEADRIRKELLAQGIVLKDSPTGTTWEAAS